MPASRLPWIKFWPEALEHAKFAELTDSEAWTWVVVWAKASQQANRWEFASVSHAAKVTARPAKHIRRLMDVGLIDDQHGRVVVHDANDWQRWRPDDTHANTNGTTHEGLSNDSPTTSQAHANGSATAREYPLKKEREIEKRDRDVDVDERTTLPVGSPQPENGRATEIDASFQTELEDEFWEAFGTREAVRDAIAVALSHKARRKCTDQRAYLRNWIRKDAETATKRRVGSARESPAVLGPPLCDRCGKPAYVHHKGMCRDCNLEIRAEAAKNGAKQEDA